MAVENQKLQEYFHFDEADLEANRQGRFSENQQVRLIENDKKIQRKWGWRSIPFLLIASVGPVFALFAGHFFGGNWNVIRGIGWNGLWGGIGLVIADQFTFKIQELVLAKATGKVKSS